MSWWRRLLARNSEEKLLDKELRFHLDHHAADLMQQGKTAEEARRLAWQALGGPEQVKEQCRDERGARWLEEAVHDARYALRAFRQYPGFAAIALLTLALGTGATTVMFTILSSVLLKPLAYSEPDRLVALRMSRESFGSSWGFSYPDFLDVRQETHALGRVAAWTYGGGTLSSPGNPEYVEGRQISSELFSTLGISPLEGRGFLPDEDRPGGPAVVVISDALWRRRFGGSRAAIGAPLTYEGNSYRIVGVAPSNLRLDGVADVFVPLGQVNEVRMQNRAARFIHVLARIHPDAAVMGVANELSTISARLAERYPATNKGFGMSARPLQQELVAGVQSTLWLLLGAVSLLLLIACVNVASLLLARAISRERELAMRVALGAGRGRLIRQCLTESMVLGVCGGVFGVLLAALGTRPFLSLWPGSLPRSEDIQMDWRVLLFALSVSLMSGFLFGVAPALRAPRHSLDRELRAGGRTIRGNSRRLHGVFVVSEIALAMVLLMSAGVLGRLVLRVSSLNPGFDVEHVLTARVALSPGAIAHPATLRATWQDFLERASRVPGVQAVSLSDIVPMRVGQNVLGYSTTAEPQATSQLPVALATVATPGYVRVMGIPLLKGRFIDDHDRLDSTPIVVIDEQLAREAFGGAEPVGKRLWIPALGAPVEIVGVVGHVRHWGLADDDQSLIRHQLYYPFAQVPDKLMRLFSSFMSVEVRTAIPPLNVASTLQQAIRGAAADQTLYEIRTAEQLVNFSLARHRFLLLLFSIFAGLALVLACIGLYGVIAYLTRQRVPEIGVRMAAGARAGQILRLVLQQSLLMAVGGISTGAAATFATGRVLERLVPGSRAPDLWTWIVISAVLLAAAFMATLVPAWRASRIDPVNALRTG
jgi:predicted permease